MISRPLVTLVLAFSAVAAGCVNAPAPEEVEAAVTDTDLAMTGMPETDEIDGDIVFSAATPVRSVNNGGAFLTTIELTENITGFVLEVEWSAATPASERLSVWVRPAGTGTVTVPPDPSIVTAGAPTAQVDGTSPLRLALAADAFPEAGEYDVVVRASAQPVGVAVNQPFTIHVTTFQDIAFDDAYSALGEHGHEHEN